jgi:hypothetical protein
MERFVEFDGLHKYPWVTFKPGWILFKICSILLSKPDLVVKLTSGARRLFHGRKRPSTSNDVAVVEGGHKAGQALLMYGTKASLAAELSFLDDYELFFAATIGRTGEV